MSCAFGREPIFAFMCSPLIRYLIRILNMNTDRILKRVYISELEIHNAGGGQSWTGFIVSLLKLTKFDHLWDKPDSLETASLKL